MTVIDMAWPMPLILTANQRLHWAQRAKRTKALRMTACRLANGTTQYERAHIVVTVGWPDKRRRDVHNLMPTIKACIDGFVDAGLLPDDDDKHLTGPDLRAEVAGKRGYVLLRFDITPTDERSNA